MAPPHLNPLRWPAAWTDATLLRLLEGTPINCLVLETGSGLAESARTVGLTLRDANTNGPETVLKDLAWPRMKMSARGQRDDADAGPTGAPWIDSNSWVARLAAVRAPERPVWLDFVPPRDEPPPTENAYVTAIADSCATGARWTRCLRSSGGLVHRAEACG